MFPLDSADLMKARERLLNGDVVAIPTETVYGLAASIDSEVGLRKVFALKERPFFDPLIVHVSSFKEAASVTRDWPPLADYLARIFWPGALTIVLPKADHVNPLITSGLDSVAVRFPAHSIAQDLIRLVGAPLAAPSANKFGRTSPSTAAHVRAEFQNTDLLILDGGDCVVGVESTVIAIERTSDNVDVIKILRPGGVTEEMLKASALKWGRETRFIYSTSEAAPGGLKHHYMPKIPLIIVQDGDAPLPGSTLLRKVEIELKLASIRNVQELELSENPAEAARELYSEMRRLAESGADLLYVRSTPERNSGHLWTAIWDRLTRAASLNLA